MSDQTIRIKYVGTAQRWPEISNTGRQSVWMPGQIESRSPSEASALLATGLFSSPPVPVLAETSPGGGIASLIAGAYPLYLQGASLLDRVPLPRMRPILTPRDVNLAAAVIPAGASISIESAPDEMYGECMRIYVEGGVR